MFLFPILVGIVIGSRLASCHSFKVVSIAILSVFLILSTMSTFVFNNNVNISVKALIKCFLSLEIPISSSKSSCTYSAILVSMPNIPSVESLSPLPS